MHERFVPSHSLTLTQSASYTSSKESLLQQCQQTVSQVKGLKVYFDLFNCVAPQKTIDNVLENESEKTG